MKKIMPTVYFFILLMAAIGLHLYFPVLKIIDEPFNYLGILLIILGIVINVWTDTLFKKSRTTVKPHELPTSLETGGPFCISRHPMYLGMFLILLGSAVLMGSLICFLFPIFFIILMEMIFISDEENNLENVFGQKYLYYRKKVRRWI